MVLMNKDILVQTIKQHPINLLPVHSAVLFPAHKSQTYGFFLKTMTEQPVTTTVEPSPTDVGAS